MKIFFTGIKGTGMASLAQILQDLGHEVSGSDIAKYIFTQDDLAARKIGFKEFSKENITDDLDLLIVGNSFDESHEEVLAAREKGIEVLWYNEFLGRLLQDYQSICIAGCHGKSTTTGMLSAIFKQAGPVGYLIGDGEGHIEPEADYFILEACEFQRHFLSYHPDYAILTNIELDHVDYYKDLGDYKSAFQSFVNQIKTMAVINGDDVELTSLHYPETLSVITFGLQPKNEYQAKDIKQSVKGTDFAVYKKGSSEPLCSIHLDKGGIPYVYDALAALALSDQLGLDLNLIVKALDHYQGIHRRFDEIILGESVLIDDYAHHPTAISYMIDTLKARYPDKKIIALYKPDRYSRVQYFLDAFARALNKADKQIVFDFPANAKREDKSITVTIEDLLERLDQGALLQVDEASAALLAKEAPAVFAFMSSKDLYLLDHYLARALKPGESS